ncbi:MAG: DMT family transporter [Acholeplasmataceae bacterium]|nr:DMT family transporter [Acholeplasmataceae bacterium]
MKDKKYIFYAILAALLYALSTPISKLLLDDLSPVFIASLLYLGAGIGMSVVGYIRKKTTNYSYKKFTKNELPAIIGMIVLDILAPISLMIGLQMSHPENVSLLNNFEIVATSLIAYFIFKEVIPKRLRIAIILVTVASIILSFEDLTSFKFSIGSIFVLMAASFWGLENNLTRKLSFNDPLMVVVIKGLFSGLGSLSIALFMQQINFKIDLILWTLLLGFIAYGLSIFFYVTAQKALGAAKTSTFYAFAPFVGALLSLMIFQEMPQINFFIALIIMGLGSYYASTDHKESRNKKGE